MINFESSTIEDQSRIAEWMQADPYHCSGYSHDMPGWWITGQECLLAGRLRDEQGIVLYFRFDIEDGFARMHTQFAPEEQVNKKRVALAIIQGIVFIVPFLREKGAKGIVYESISPSLIEFMGKKGFIPRPGGKEFLDDYVLMF
jgi:hypothetical protein